MSETSSDDQEKPLVPATLENEAAGKTVEQTSSLADSHAAREHSLVMTPLPGLIFALLAGLAAWGTLEMIMPVFDLPDRLKGLTNAPEAELQEMRIALRLTQDRNAILALVMLASTLAIVLTATELFCRKRPLGAIWGGLLAGLIAGVIAFGAGSASAVLHDALGLHGVVEHQSSRLGKTILVQVLMLGVVGVGIGIAMGTPLFRPRLFTTCAVGCLMGGLLAALVFPIAASVCLPNVNTELLVPSAGIGRLLWATLATGLMGVTVSGLGKAQKKTRVAAT